MISVAGPADRPAAVRRLFAPPAADRLLAGFAAGTRSADFLLVARRAGKVVGAVFADLHPDRLADVRPPAADDPLAADALAGELVRRLRAAGTAVAQCLLPENGTCSALVRAGFRPVTRLVTLHRPPGPVIAGGPLRFDPAADLVETFAATLVGSLDLPELTGLRPPAVELAGYPAARRLLATLAGRPVGVLLLAPGEVVYLGLTPEARGRGLGSALLRHAVAELAPDGATVSGDGRNWPALDLYGRHGFRPAGVQEVLLWTPART